MLTSALMMLGVASSSSAITWSFQTVNAPGMTDTFLYGMNASHVAVGNGIDASGNSYGVKYISGVTTATSNDSFGWTEYDDINATGQVAASWVDDDEGVQTSKLLAANGTMIDNITVNDENEVFTTAAFGGSGNYTGAYVGSGSDHVYGYQLIADVPYIFAYPDATEALTQCFDANASDTAVGYWMTGAGYSHGFTRTSSGTFTQYDVPGYDKTQLFGIDSVGNVAGVVQNLSSWKFYGFVRINGNVTMVSVPGALSTAVQSISDNGDICGFYVGSDGHYHGFIGTAATGGTSLAIRGARVIGM